MTRPLRRIWLLLLALSALVVFDAFILEVNFPRLERVEVAHPELPAAFDGFKIIFIVDTHTTRFGRREERIINLVNKFSPDLIILGGDYIGYPEPDFTHERLVSEAGRLFASLRSTCGVYAISGNWDIRRDIPEYEKEGAKWLDNRSAVVRRDSEKIYLVGLSFYRKGMKGAFEGVPAEEFIIVVSHLPDNLDEGLAFGVDLGLAGHSHGGQTIIPLFRNPSPWGCRKYQRGRYRVGSATFYVSRGAGAHFNLRFLCPAEVTAITLKKKK